MLRANFNCSILTCIINYYDFVLSTVIIHCLNQGKEISFEQFLPIPVGDDEANSDFLPHSVSLPRMMFFNLAFSPFVMKPVIQMKKE